MFLTYSDIKSQHFRNIGKAGIETDTILLADFNYSLGQRYQMIFGSLDGYINEDTVPDVAVIGQQYYPTPNATVNLDTVTITIGSRKYPLQPIYSQQAWDTINALPAPSTFPQFVFARNRDYGIWPIPTTAGSVISFNRFFRDKSLSVEDVTTGTATIDKLTQVFTVAAITLTEAMIGRYFIITDTTVDGYGYWYRISAITSDHTFSTEVPWTGASSVDATYRIGQVPAIPAEGHTLLADGTTADYYAGLRNSPENSDWFDNMFWTGSGKNFSRDEDDKNIKGGLLGIIKKYKDRDRDHLVNRNPGGYMYDPIFSTIVS